MRSITLALAGLLMLTAAGVRADETIYQPAPMVDNGLNDLTKPSTQHGMLGLGYTTSLIENTGLQNGVLVSARYFTGDKWYALGEVEMATYSTNTLVADDSVNVPDDSTRYALGMGYSLLQGNASVSGKTVMPFVLAVELAAGEQSFGDTGGLYLSGGISTQVHWKKYWGALGIRQFNLDENAQPLINSEWGIQWDIQLGFWF
ncbi:MAG TPA: hypothetical protein DEA26_04605 [Oceanospirillales bacterium]|nr:hypothetical protein [Oceanospirillaceae bacterium]HBS41939.1 hypothetical protein [Oceanospirillales bacterium]|tara:strand:+ start:172 stop:780 length:609 start_codon:yes stop_codon:yes gene_type:complete